MGIRRKDKSRQTKDKGRKGGGAYKETDLEKNDKEENGQ
jgi:hypothetical protein